MSVLDSRGSKLPVKRSIKDAASEILRVKMAVVGLNFGRHVVNELISQPVSELIELKVVCDLDRARALAVAASTGAEARFDLDQVLSDPMIEAIALITGPNGRAELIRRIVHAGKHVITTKPFELNPDAALSVLKEAKSLGKLVHMNSPSPRLSADLQQVRIWQQKYNLGRPIACRRACWASYREQADGTWYDDPELCPVAPIFRIGIYCINDLVRLLGPAHSVNAISSRLFTGRPTPDNAQISILFKSGAIGSIFASFCVNDGNPYAYDMTFNFENGTVFRNVGPQRQGNKGVKSRMSVVACRDGDEPLMEHVDLNEASGEYLWGDFVRAVRGEQLVDQVTPEEIAAGIEIVRAMARSAKSRRTEDVTYSAP